MNEQEFLTNVRDQAGLESADEARAATEATLHVLGSRITETEAEDLAAQLPEAFGPNLTWESGTEPKSFDVESFVERVRERESDDNRIDESESEAHARAVAATLTDAVSGGELSDVRSQLPDEYDQLFDGDGTRT